MDSPLSRVYRSGEEVLSAKTSLTVGGVYSQITRSKTTKQRGLVSHLCRGEIRFWVQNISSNRKRISDARARAHPYGAPHSFGPPAILVVFQTIYCSEGQRPRRPRYLGGRERAVRHGTHGTTHAAAAAGEGAQRRRLASQNTRTQQSKSKSQEAFTRVLSWCFGGRAGRAEAPCPLTKPSGWFETPAIRVSAIGPLHASPTTPSPLPARGSACAGRN